MTFDINDIFSVAFEFILKVKSNVLVSTNNHCRVFLMTMDLLEKHRHQPTVPFASAVLNIYPKD